jgi:hypothetical protein
MIITYSFLEYSFKFEACCLVWPPTEGFDPLVVPQPYRIPQCCLISLTQGKSHNAVFKSYFCNVTKDFIDFQQYIIKDAAWALGR